MPEPRRIEALDRRSLVFAACGAAHNLLLLGAVSGGPWADDESESDEGSASSVGESATTAGPKY